MNDVEDTQPRRAEFGRALERSLDGRTAAWLGSEIARAVGKDSPLSQSAVSQWITGKTEPDRVYVFAAEKVLEMPAGSLSAILGYLPVEAVPALTVLDALERDTNLTKRGRAIVRAAYLTATE